MYSHRVFKINANAPPMASVATLLSSVIVVITSYGSGSCTLEIVQIPFSLLLANTEEPIAWIAPPFSFAQLPEKVQ